MRAGQDIPRSEFAYAYRLYRRHNIRWAALHSLAFVWRNR